jgi:cardiolipin synthase
MDAFWAFFLAALNFSMTLVASGHAILNKRDAPTTIGWVGLIWLAPILGATAYYLLGINRIRRRGHALREPPGQISERAAQRRELERDAWASSPYTDLASLARLVRGLTGRPLLSGNSVEALVDGEQAYPQMLEAIAAARMSVTMCSYIFDNDTTGSEFLQSLAAAAARGVRVRVLIDDVGSRYSRPSMVSRLRAAGLNVAVFLPTRVPRLFHYANLRNHRKLLVVDGQIGFTGGMNIREGHRLDVPTAHPVQDVHFRISGPVVAQMQEVFVADWVFCTGERLSGDTWFSAIAETGPVFARAIADGPDEDFEKLRMTILGALSGARRRICVMTPYFLPDGAISTALTVAAMRGVRVDVVVPEHNNIAFVQWAAAAGFKAFLERGCHIWLAPRPFDHTKITVVDGAWSLVGSTNWDPRSLRLNFELNLECYDRELAAGLEGIVATKIATGREVSLDEVAGKHLLLRLRDGAARLFSPYL